MRITLRCSSGMHGAVEAHVQLEDGTRVEDLLRKFHGQSLAVWYGSDYGGAGPWMEKGDLKEGECYLISSKDEQKTLDAMRAAHQRYWDLSR